MSALTAPEIDTVPPAGAELVIARSCFPARFEHFTVTDPARGRRIEIADPEGDGHWVLGPAEFEVARLFDGRSSFAEISARLAARGVRADATKLARFEAKLLGLGLLEIEGRGNRPRDPFTGFDFALLHHLVIQRLGVIRPEPTLNRILAWPRAVQTGLLGLAAMAALAAPVLLVIMGSSFLDHAKATLTGWMLPLLYIVTLASGLLHEGGHAVACRVFGVKVRETGFAIYFLMPFAWTRPDRRDWEALPMRPRMIAILAGPFASLALAGLGLMLMMVTPAAAVSHATGVILAAAGLFGATVTLMPFLNGDGYLMLTEMLRLPNLRRRAFDHLRRIAGLPAPTLAAPLPRGRGVLLLAVALSTVLGWAGIWVGMAWWLGGAILDLIR